VAHYHLSGQVQFHCTACAHSMTGFLTLPLPHACCCLQGLSGVSAEHPGPQRGTSPSLGLAARGRIPFQLAAVFVDERIATGIPDEEADKVVAEVSAICSVFGGCATSGEAGERLWAVTVNFTITLITCKVPLTMRHL